MSCPHSLIGTADRCSQCLEVTGAIRVRRIDQADGTLTIDGVAARPIDVETTHARNFYGRRGGKAAARVTRVVRAALGTSKP